MADVTLNVAGRAYGVACRDGEEPALRGLAAMLERHSAAAQRASGGSPERTLLYIALMLADELSEHEANPQAGLPPAMLERIAERLEAAASALEERPTDP